MTLLYILIIAILLIMLISIKLGLTTYVTWIEENHFKQPAQSNMNRLIAWCAKNYAKDLFRKS